MPKLTLHPDSEAKLTSLRKSPPQSLLIHGERGVGLLTIARDLSGKAPILIVPEGETQSGSIKTERIRQLYDETRGASASKQFVIIDDADRMTKGAQSAFLKLLEEPNRNTYFILTSHDKDRLLPTIISRLQSHHLALPSEQQTLRLITTLIDDESLRHKIAFLAPRHPSLIYRYAAESSAFEKDAAIMSDARKCLSSNEVYQRQIIALSHSTTRDGALSFLDFCIHILRFTLTKSPPDAMPDKIERYLDARDAIERNANTKLTLTHLMV